MLDWDERATVAHGFGVDEQQVERDHLVSLLLARLGAGFAESVVFIGGTALARTHLPDGRLSEDVDLVAIGDRAALARALDEALPAAAMRDYGRMTWQPALADVRDTGAAFLATEDGPTVKIQLLSAIGIPRWPTEFRRLVQRYSDVPATSLRVLTLAAFAASKAAAWCDRAAPRDLWDLWALSDIGAIDQEAAALFKRFGPTNRPPRSWQFEKAPTESQWRAQLAGQTRLDVRADDALDIVRVAWERAGATL